MNGIVELAKILKERENDRFSPIQTGRVIAPLPEIKIALGDKIILTRQHLIFSAHLLNNYERQFSLRGELTFAGTNSSCSASGQLTLAAGLKTGDVVILMAARDQQSYYVIDKAVRL